jgi:hypothetical protein
MNPEVFTAEVVQSWKGSPEIFEKIYQALTNAVLPEDWGWPAMVPLEEFSGHHRKHCLLCQLIKEAVDNHLSHYYLG